MEVNIVEAMAHQQSEYGSVEAMKLTVGQKVLVTREVGSTMDCTVARGETD